MSYRRSPSSRGYSLAEMLVVIAIIGIMSMVSVPMFMNFVRSNKLKTAMRQFTNDLRASRQRAITQNHPTMISFKNGPNLRTYWDYDGTLGAGGVVTYTPTPRNPERILDNISYFKVTADPCVFDDVVTSPPSTNGWNDIVFLPNGTIGNIPGPPGTPGCTSLTGKIFLSTEYNVPKQTYEILGHPSGLVKVK